MTTITLPRKTVQQALDAMELSIPLGSDVTANIELSKYELRAALEKPQAEPGSADYVVRLLVAAGHVTSEKVDEAYRIAGKVEQPGAAATADRTNELEALLREARGVFVRFGVWGTLVARIDAALGGKP